MTSSSLHVSIHDDLNALSKVLEEEFLQLIRAGLGARGRFSVALTGGRSAGKIYERIAESGGAEAASSSSKTNLDWSQVKIFWGDERAVPPDSPDSNFKTAHDAWLAKSSIPAGNIFPWRTQADDSLAEADRYADAIAREVPPNPARRGGIPSFDLILLGMGDDGHVASLFPGSPALEYKTELTAWNFISQLGAHRFTFTLPLINAAREIWMVVTGESKAGRVAQVLAAQHAGEEILHLPATRVRPASGKLRWWLDKGAASMLNS